MSHFFYSALITVSVISSLHAQIGECLPLSSSSSEAVGYYKEALQAVTANHIERYEEFFYKAIYTDRDFFMMYVHRGFWAMSTSDNENMNYYFKKALSCSGKLNVVENEIREAIKMLVKDNFADVGKYGNKIAKLHPHCIEAQLWKGYLNMRSNHPEPAAEAFRAILRLNPDYKIANYMLGYAYLQLEELYNARKAFETFLLSSPHLPNSYDGLGDYFMAAKDYKNALKYYEKAAAIDENRTLSQAKAMKARELMNQ